MAGRAFSGKVLEEFEENTEDLRVKKKPKHLLLPHQPMRLVWDMAGLFLIMVDAFLLPLSLAWDLGIEPIDAGAFTQSQDLGVSQVHEVMSFFGDENGRDLD